MTYLFLEDAGHGWLVVPVETLLRLNIERKISDYSYLVMGKTINAMSGRLGLHRNKLYALLEEDMDMGTFIDASGVPVKWTRRHIPMLDRSLHRFADTDDTYWAHVRSVLLG